MLLLCILLLVSTLSFYLLIIIVPVEDVFLQVLLCSFPSACLQSHSNFTCATLCQESENFDDDPFTERSDFLTLNQLTLFA